jgi:hypothetical protein
VLVLQGAWPAKRPVVPVAGDGEAETCCGKRAWASVVSACALEGVLAVVAWVVSLVGPRWSLGALRRAGDEGAVFCSGDAALAGPLCAFDAQCELSRSRGLGLGAAESAVVSGAKVESAAAGAKVESAAAADGEVAAAIAWVAEAGTASVLELAVLLWEAWRGAIAWDLAGGVAAASSSRAALVAPRFGSGLCCCCCVVAQEELRLARLVRRSCCDMDACTTATTGCCWFEQSARPALCY